MVTKTIDITTMQAFKDALLPLLERDTELILVEGDTLVAKVTPITQSSQNNFRHLTGIFRGMMTMSDDFDDPLPDEFWR
jgi:antitoxin (DNA-binding transcriptional repressor) of toxin-antitoxin stability system